MNLDLPDPLDFAVAVLARRGALVERAGPEALALLPDEIAAALGAPAELRLADGGDHEAVACGLGSALGEKLIALARQSVPVTRVELSDAPPRRAQVESACARFVVRNGVCDLVDIAAAPARYFLFYLRHVVESDDRYEGMSAIAIDGGTGAAMDDALAERLHPARLPEGRGEGPAPEMSPEIVSLVRQRAAGAVAPAVEAVRASVARRFERDHERIVEYFATLTAEARRPRRATAPPAIAAKLAQLAAERRQKLADLQARYALRVTVEPIAVVVADARVAEARLRLRRRKGERELILRVAGGARGADSPACEGCAGATLRPVLCDDRLHLLCDRCVPSAEGRPRCPACRRA